MTGQTIDQLLSDMIASRDGISDLLFTVGKPPLLEVHGAVEEYTATVDVFDREQINRLADHFTDGDERLARDLAEWGSCDCSYALQDLARFRVNIFKQNGRPAIVMRKLQSGVPTLDELQLPPVFQEMVKEKNGIIFVTGATGSGKTTTLA